MLYVAVRVIVWVGIMHYILFFVSGDPGGIAPMLTIDYAALDM